MAYICAQAHVHMHAHSDMHTGTHTHTHTHTMLFASSFYRAKDSSLNIVVADDISEVSMKELESRQAKLSHCFTTLLSFPFCPQQLGELSYCCTKEELFSKLRELMEYKTRCIELTEEVNR